MAIYTDKEMADLELYPEFKESFYRIGSTRYKLVEYSIMLAGVFIKNDHDGKHARFRQIEDFFGEDSYVQAYKCIQDRMNN